MMAWLESGLHSWLRFGWELCREQEKERMGIGKRVWSAGQSNLGGIDLPTTPLEVTHVCSQGRETD